MRAILSSRGLTTRHAQDLLSAFRQDATKHRYANWDELIDYCSRSAMPVGRFVLDVHGEARDTWPGSDALCAALQIINHLQDCAKDYRALDRVYIPLDALAASGAGVETLSDARASPALRNCLRGLVGRTSALLHESRGLEAKVNDTRLALEISVIQSLASQLLTILWFVIPCRARAPDKSRSAGSGCKWRWTRYTAPAIADNDPGAPISDPMNMQTSN